MDQAMQFERGKFKELVVYLCAAAEQDDDDGFGMVKLNKLLYRSDFEAYRLLGRPITGETYEKQEFGPVARDLPIVLDELAAAGRLQWQAIPTGPHTRKVPTVVANPDAVADTSNFPSEEMQIVQTTREELSGHGAKSASAWSHEQSAGWRMAQQYGEIIEYETALLSTEQVPEAVLIRASQYVRERGLVRSV